MRKLVFVSILLSIALSAYSQTLGSKQRYCKQMGYSVEGDYCLFPDGNRCKLEDFNTGGCGEKYFLELECIEKGRPLFDGDTCCAGLIPYDKINFFGHPTCQTKQKVYVNQLLGNDIFWFGSVFILVAIWFFLQQRKSE